MKCEICDQEFANSEELDRHREREHPARDDGGEMPDLMDTPATERELSEPAERKNR
ncbi:MAG TPA: C2H2-type zinc finger protein [Candidatus Sulfotelmatobacter sp.]|nr:C2H2-type zinc finger protein [Candidatus Sulfotelmatobacter sp.]